MNGCSMRTGVLLSRIKSEMNAIAPRKAQELAHANVEPSHLLWAMLHDSSGLSAALAGAGIDLLYACDWAETRMEGAMKAKGTPAEPEPSVASDDVLKEARRLSGRFPKGSATGENAALLAVLCRPGLAFSKDQLKTFPLTEKMVLEIFSSGPALEENGKAANGTTKPGKSGNALTTYCTVMTMDLDLV